MADRNDEIIGTLNGLIETCKDGEKGFRDAAEGSQRADLKTFFNTAAARRGQFAADLQAHVARLGGDPEKGGSVAGALHRGWLNLAAAVTGKNDHTILAECERGEDAAIENYREALNKTLPEDIRSAVQEQFVSVRETHVRVRSMRDSTDEDKDGNTPLTGATVKETTV